MTTTATHPKVKPAIRDLLPALSAEEIAGLEESVRRESDWVLRPWWERAWRRVFRWRLVRREAWDRMALDRVKIEAEAVDLRVQLARFLAPSPASASLETILVEQPRICVNVSAPGIEAILERIACALEPRT